MKLEWKRYNLYLHCWLQFWFDAVLEGLKHPVFAHKNDHSLGSFQQYFLWLDESQFRNLGEGVCGGELNLLPLRERVKLLVDSKLDWEILEEFCEFVVIFEAFVCEEKIRFVHEMCMRILSFAPSDLHNFFNKKPSPNQISKVSNIEFPKWNLPKPWKQIHVFPGWNKKMVPSLIKGGFFFHRGFFPKERLLGICRAPLQCGRFDSNACGDLWPLPQADSGGEFFYKTPKKTWKHQKSERPTCTEQSPKHAEHCMNCCIFRCTVRYCRVFMIFAWFQGSFLWNTFPSYKHLCFFLIHDFLWQFVVFLLVVRCLLVGFLLLLVCRLPAVGCFLFFFGIAKSLSKLVILTCFFVSNLFESLVFLRWEVSGTEIFNGCEEKLWTCFSALNPLLGLLVVSPKLPRNHHFWWHLFWRGTCSPSNCWFLSIRINFSMNDFPTIKPYWCSRWCFQTFLGIFTPNLGEDFQFHQFRGRNGANTILHVRGSLGGFGSEQWKKGPRVV